MEILILTNNKRNLHISSKSIVRINSTNFSIELEIVRDLFC